ncbi:retron St85 family RNA-directed DNA polymerase [Acinetobacter variabilis]|uniref:retron St85 family RNA-directed DNA polymerase n=1 Tax=Acinetobacter variabilis TaxID=70346 RepID=UPI00289B0928|nr:retron St85 family RNA-directed DNA polymerase [Acinetobacter variabilis]
MQLSQWETYFQDIGISEQYIEEYLEIISKLSKKKLPIIFEIEQFSKLVGVELNTLYKMIFSPENFYHEFYIKKKKGGHRKIVVPFPSLLLVQRWIYKNILLKCTCHSNIHGFIQKKSIITNARAHIGGRDFLKLDLQNFFPSISLNWVIQYFNELGYPKKISFYLASLCCYEEGLGQGAPTSPFLSNLLLFSLDKRLNNLAKKNECTYTRYADDIVFSGEKITKGFYSLVESIVCDFGLNLNESKTQLRKNKTQNIITGIAVLNDGIKIPKTYKKKIRQEIYYINKYGLMSHLSKIRNKNPTYLLSLLGKINYVLSVENDNQEFKEYQRTLENFIKNPLN